MFSLKERRHLKVDFKVYNPKTRWNFPRQILPLLFQLISPLFFSHLLGLVWTEGSYGNWTPSLPAISATSSLATRWSHLVPPIPSFLPSSLICAMRLSQLQSVRVDSSWFDLAQRWAEAALQLPLLLATLLFRVNSSFHLTWLDWTFAGGQLCLLVGLPPLLLLHPTCPAPHHQPAHPLPGAAQEQVFRKRCSSNIKIIQVRISEDLEETASTCPAMSSRGKNKVKWLMICDLRESKAVKIGGF